jgi:hypothetical protein
MTDDTREALTTAAYAAVGILIVLAFLAIIGGATLAGLAAF